MTVPVACGPCGWARRVDVADGEGRSLISPELKDDNYTDDQ